MVKEIFYYFVINSWSPWNIYYISGLNSIIFKTIFKKTEHFNVFQASKLAEEMIGDNYYLKKNWKYQRKYEKLQNACH